MFCLPVVKTEDGQLSVSYGIMALVWEQIVNEGKKDLLFYDGAVRDLKDWINYIYNPSNYVILVIDDEGHIYHIAWVNKFYQGHGFLHHCSLGKYNRHSWPLVRDYWAGIKDTNGNQLLKTLMGVTPVSNELAVRLVKMLGWTVLGEIPNLCYLFNEKKHVPGMISYYVLQGG